MKKLSFLLIVFVLGTNLVNAVTLTPVDAQKVAEKFYKQYSNKVLEAATLTYTKMSSEGEAVFYVFNLNENDGFIVIAANDGVLPVIKYSTLGKFISPIPNSKVETIEMWEADKWATASSNG